MKKRIAMWLFEGTMGEPSFSIVRILNESIRLSVKDSQRSQRLWRLSSLKGLPYMSDSRPSWYICRVGGMMRKFGTAVELASGSYLTMWLGVMSLNTASGYQAPESTKSR